MAKRFVRNSVDKIVKKINNIEHLYYFRLLRILTDFSIIAVMGYRFEPKVSHLQSFKKGVRNQFLTPFNLSLIPSPTTAIIGFVRFFVIYASTIYFLWILAKEKLLETAFSWFLRVIFLLVFVLLSDKFSHSKEPVEGRCH